MAASGIAAHGLVACAARGTGRLRSERRAWPCSPGPSSDRDRLDILCFAGDALQNDLRYPHLLALPGVRVTGAEPGRPEGVLRLCASFGAQVPTRSALQTFHVEVPGSCCATTTTPT